MSTPKKPEYRHIGKYRPRKDAREIVTGKCIYLDDFKMKDMLHAKLMPSPYAHAIIKDIDASKAEALPGVYAVVTYKNQPEFSKEFLQGLPPVKKVCDQHLRYVGDCVALIAAETEELCEEAYQIFLKISMVRVGISPWVRKQCSVCTAGTAAFTDVSKPCA